MAATEYPTEHFESPEHALIAGMVMGIAMRHGMSLTPVTDEEGYTNRFEVVDGGLPGNVRVFVTVEPPVERGPFE